MKHFFLLLAPCFYYGNTNSNAGSAVTKDPETKQFQFTKSTETDIASWNYFLQHLPEIKALVLDYKGNQISKQEKHFSIINYDVGTRDLQQCADALMRLRAEYLFGQKRFDEIGFHFVSGQYYRFLDYCKGLRPVADGNAVRFFKTAGGEKTHQNLRKYLNHVYTYASTIFLAKELKTTYAFKIGTVVIYAGSPGHCFISVDEAIANNGKKLFKLVEGYTPAQSIYVLQNHAEPSLWYGIY